MTCRTGRKRAVLVALMLAVVLVGAADAVAATTSRPDRAAGATRGGVAASNARRPVWRKLVTIGAPRVTRGDIRLRWRVRRTLSRAGIRLNGHRVTDVRLAYRRGQRTVVALDGADGVRFGRNVVVVSVRGSGGPSEVLRRVVLVRDDAPIVSLTAARGATVGRVVRLDGRGSHFATHRRVSYRWRIVRAPRGAHARLRRTRSARPTLVASRPGRYWIALTVAARGSARRGRASAAASCSALGSPPPSGGAAAAPSAAVASTPPVDLSSGSLTAVRLTGAKSPSSPAPPAAPAAPGCATHVEAVSVAPNVTPMGAAIDTQLTQNGQTGVAVAGNFYPVPGAGGGAEILLFDAQTLEPLGQFVDPSALPASDEAEALAYAYSSAGDDVLIVVSGVANCCANDSSDSTSGFSMIENYIQGGGTQTTNEGMSLRDGAGAPGEMVGWLQTGVPLDGSPALYSFVSPDRAAFDTQVADSPTTNMMQVGGKLYSSTLPADSTAGFQVLVTNATLQPVLGTPTAFGTDIPVPGQAQAQELAMSTLLGNAIKQPGTTVFVQSIGDPTPSSQYAVAVDQQLQLLGGTQGMFLGLNGSGGYALVGNIQPPGETAGTAETSEQWTSSASGGQGAGSGSLNGLLRRRFDSAYAPTLADAVNGSSQTAPDFGLAQVAYQPAQPWPVDSTAGEQAATTWFAEQLNLTPGPGSCYQPPQPDFRSSYCNLAISPTVLVQELQALDYSSGEGFTRADFSAVRTELSKELDDVATVEQLITTLQTPFGSPAVNPATDAQSIAGDVISDLPTPSTPATSADLSIVGSVFDAAALVPEVGDALGAVGAVLDFASAVTQSNGTTRPYWQVQAAADSIGSVVQQRLATMSGAAGQLEEILVSDYGKLSTAATNANGPWGVSEAGLQQEESTLQLGIEQWMWTSIAPAAFTLDTFPPGNPSQLKCEINILGDAWYPWAQAASQSIFLPLVNWYAGGPQADVMLAMLSGSVSHKSSISVTGSLANEMFNTPQQGGAGLISPLLLSQGSWTFATPPLSSPNIDQTGSCVENVAGG